ncbi:zinc-binding dehydrogenase [Nocardia harenae]|uniref:zinc-binding dehydrogenase n=1 Tax=Nocardia harenae TaxID=358707 RepID=UPI001FDFC026|nr:zinc-binding dehydrogenase [Nocardia harenae]
MTSTSLEVAGWGGSRSTTGVPPVRAIRVLETRALAAWREDRWRPVTHRFPLAEAAQAHKALETRGTAGKVVLIP